MATPPSATWTVEAPDQETVSALSRTLECSPVLATALASRDYTDPDDAEEALDPTPRAIQPPTQLPAVEAAVDRLNRALEAGERIAVFADRDVDGVMGGTALVRALQLLEGDVTFRAPDRWDGYGLGADHVTSIADDGTDLVVTVDCGTTAHEAITAANDIGVDVVVTDHHPPPRERCRRPPPA